MSNRELSDSFDWDLLVQSRLNAILCGDSVTVDLTLTSLRDHLQLPLHAWSFRGGTPSPSIHAGTLIVTDVAGTTLEEQRAFLGWLDAHRAIRVITLSESPLYDLVRDGVLLEQLYYRLNPIYCALAGSPEPSPGYVIDRRQDVPVNDPMTCPQCGGSKSSCRTFWRSLYLLQTARIVPCSHKQFRWHIVCT